MKKIIVWGLRGVGGCFLMACVLFLVRGRGFSVMGIPNPPPTLCLLAGAGSLMAAYLLQEKGPERKFRVANLVLMSFSFLVLAAIGEVGIRMFLQRTQGFNSVQQMFNPNPDGNLPTDSHHPLLVITRLSADKRLIYELQPNLDREFGHKLLRTNAAGMREDENFTLQKPADTLRIVGVGDSGMWGWSLDQGQGYMEVMERRLNQTDGLPHVQVLNMAVPGYNTYQELQTLRAKGLAYQPDVVVIGWCDNDDMLPFFMYSRRNHWKEPGSYFLSMLINRRSFLEKVTPQVLKLGDMPEGSVDAEVMRYAGREGVLASLKLFRSLGEQHGFRVVLFGPLKEEIQELGREAGVEMINTFDLKETDPPEDCHVFYMHPKACGHEILGEFLAERLLQSGWLRESGSR
jgi:hypothetical protein